uniref:Nucleotidyl transferase domain-containing protein n=1 Tax=Plectus sambesii TaxID=2011161 RepID=A0A914VP99_9BILA
MSYKAVILIGGPQKGTRFRPLSLEQPKPLFPIAGFPTIQHHIEQLCSKVEGLREILLIGFYQPSEIISFVSQAQRDYSVNIRYLQEFTALGTAGGIYHFRDQILFGRPTAVFIINADVCGDLPLDEMVAFRGTKPEASCIVLTTEATREQSVHYGCVVVDADSNEVMHYVEKPTTFVSTNISCGIYLVTVDLFEQLSSAFDKRSQLALHNDGDSMEPIEAIWFEADIFPNMASTGRFFALHTTRWWSQIKTAAAAVYANRHYLRLYHETHPQRLSKQTDDGPTIVGDVYIHPSATVDASAKIGPNVSIGKTVIVGPGVRLKESIVLEGAVLQDHSCVMHSIIGWNSVVGQWARVEGTPIGPNPNMPFAKLENKPLFKPDGRLNPALTILGCNVQIPRETIVLNSIVLPHKELSGNYKNQIIL